MSSACSADVDYVTSFYRLVVRVCAVSIHPAGCFSRKWHFEKYRKHFRFAAFIICHECWETLTRGWVSWFSSRLQLFFCHKVYVTKQFFTFASLQICNTETKWPDKNDTLTNMSKISEEDRDRIKPESKTLRTAQTKGKAAKFEKKATFLSDSRRGMWGRTVIQRYSGPLRNSGSTASWEVWEGRLTRDGAEGSFQRASLCWVTGQWGVWDGCVLKWFIRTVVLSSVFCAHVNQMRVVKLDVFFCCLSMNILYNDHSFLNCSQFCEFRL